MALMTRKLNDELEGIRMARHGLPKYLVDYIQREVAMIRRMSEEFDSRAELAQHICTLSSLIHSEIHAR